ncbi:helix-turn-helix domain-containing protein [Prauserella flavalba]|uniref:Sigma-54 factor interaction domain-containing protein n=1 Tax=Prauserella flavalba TaxID=1477506 RepID=A0A318LIR7_9PSEU|nr:helix-turn-helix domain-containing protein [Prauserella flavalba]PXY21539.1 hypothetical protein BA062_32025 [Prauserella flavalba]
MSDNAEFDRIQKAKETLLSTGTTGVAGPSTELIQSWRRSQRALGGPENVTDVPQVSEELLDAHLLNLFRDPLTRFSDSLSGTGLGLLLADSRGQILHRWCADRGAAAHLDRIGTVRGAVLSEDAVGTNGVGTVAASGRGVQIQGVEHFADFYRGAVCTGAPVRHPITGNLLAVVTLSCDVTPRTDLLRPLLDTLTTQLEQHVMDVQQPAARRAFATFLEVSRARPEPVVAFGAAGLLIQSPQAGRLSREDLRRLQELCAEASAGRHPVELSTGLTHVQVTAVDPANKVAVVFEDQRRTRAGKATERGAAARPRLIGRTPDWLAAHRMVERSRTSGTPLVIAGEAGTGKLSLALGRPARGEDGGDGPAVVDAAQRHVLGGREWLRDLAARLGAGEDLVIRGVHTLEPRLLDGMRTVLDTPHGRSVLVTLSAEAVEDAEAFALKYGTPMAWVPPLRERTADLPTLWARFAPSTDLVPDREAHQLLEAYQWPGNLTELRTVVGQLAASGHTGTVPVEQLPHAIQQARGLTMIERVELDAIRKALREAEGNRARAAQILGVSRATVYRKMKAYRLIS